MRDHHVAPVSHLQLLNQLNDFHETWYECYATGGHVNLPVRSFL
jgi:hypothetical protein